MYGYPKSSRKLNFQRSDNQFLNIESVFLACLDLQTVIKYWSSKMELWIPKNHHEL